MITTFQNVKLRTGEVVQSSIIHTPEPSWVERIISMLAHKGEPWNWQNSTILKEQIEGVDANFYVLHRSGMPFANIMTVERQGVGIFGHVWTAPGDRQKGASSILMEQQMRDFRQRNGRALYLGTGNQIAKRLYERFGFCEITSRSGLMAYAEGSLHQFEEDYFGEHYTSSARIRKLGWRHWPAACPLFMSRSPGIARHIGMGIIGLGTPEGPLLPFLQRTEEYPTAPPQMMLLELENGAVAGVASWMHDPLWPDTCLVDLYCHVNFWSHGEQLLESLHIPSVSQYIAYGDPSCQAKNDILHQAGFTQTATLPHWLIGRGYDSAVDLLLFTKFQT
ncbi:MAG: GNAT family N-acetyltransferase [Chloroflexota bacterium]